MDVADVEAMEWHAVRLRCGSACASLAILLGLSVRCDDRNVQQLLASERDSLLDRILMLELDVTNTASKISKKLT